MYKAKQIQERSTQKGMGQIFNSYAPDTNIYNEIYYKYKIEGVKVFRRLNNISYIDIEANPGVVIFIKDEDDEIGENLIINETGVLNLTELSSISAITYVGVWDDNTKQINKNVNSDLLINYCYHLIKTTYKT